MPSRGSAISGVGAMFAVGASSPLPRPTPLTDRPLDPVGAPQKPGSFATFPSLRSSRMRVLEITSPESHSQPHRDHVEPMRPPVLEKIGGGPYTAMAEAEVLPYEDGPRTQNARQHGAAERPGSELAKCLSNGTTTSSCMPNSSSNSALRASGVSMGGAERRR